MGDEVLEGYAVQLQLVFEHYTDNEVSRRRLRPHVSAAQI